MIFTAITEKIIRETECEEIRKENYRFCTNLDCGERYLNLKRKCDICEWKVVKKLNDRYVFKEDQTSSTDGKCIDIWNEVGKNLKPRVTGEPILLNPNSYQNIDSILQSFKYILRIEEEQEWALLG